ncbi:hypothetical protein [Neobacillus sp. PS3-40]|uniref:hypothetical protein n=1 Tax=Neobacillus sp. PS3-40 TaxID=3070679 RepID=UPI0027E09833|nr:hypothetical protein [Neobacillus sp. PS3-40]WML44571.1 hypothetical protein RCG20_01255 [Neobacillus sp. PS3-40]
MTESIDELIKKLNSKSVLPDSFLRRNSIYYRFFSYINNSIGLYIANNNKGTALFINRAYKELLVLKKENSLKEDSLEYFNICCAYMLKVSDYLLGVENKNDFIYELLAELNFEKLLN